MDTQALHSYARRIASELDEIDAHKENIRQIEAEARVMCSVNVKVLRKWINAERKDKVADVIVEAGDLAEYGAILGHMESFQGVRDEVPTQIEAIPDHDPDTGEIIEQDAKSPSNRDVSTDGKPCLGDASQGNHPKDRVSVPQGAERASGALAAGELAGHEGHSESAAGPDEPESTTVGNPVAILTMPDIPDCLRRTA